MESKKIIQVEEKVPFNMLVPLSIQHMFAMFGASVLVPFIFGINPAVVLFMNGIGTLFFIFITREKHRHTLAPVLHSWHRQELLSANGAIIMPWAVSLPWESAAVFWQ